MKNHFTFYFDDSLKAKTKQHGDSQNPKESISLVIHKALIKYLKLK